MVDDEMSRYQLSTKLILIPRWLNFLMVDGEMKVVSEMSGDNKSVPEN